MRMFITLSIVCLATVLLIRSTTVLNTLELQLHPDSVINGLAKYQIWALLIGTLTTIIFLNLYPSGKAFLRIGELSAIAVKEKWLGINGTSTWEKNGLQLLGTISIATGIFMLLGVKYTNSLHNFHWWFMPYVLLFAFTNSLTEEMIYRVGILTGLEGYYSKITVLIVSAILFGLPHYFGNPGGPIGVIMSGALGYILCKATIETRGIFIAWTIHFVQDILIFTAIMMMSIK